MNESRFIAASEAALLVEFGDGKPEIRLDIVQRVHRLVAVLDRAQLPGILDLTPSYSSLLVEFDPLALSLEAAESHVRFCLEQIGQIELAPTEQKEIPVFYGGEYGPDLGWAAERLGLTASQLVQAHCETIFTVAFFGFLPGFAYLEGWPVKFALPRMDSPRAKVPKGTVALAGAQCGIYPKDSPGGWRLIGRTPLELVDTARTPFSPFDLGMQIRFFPANPKTWGQR